ncbi:hypothetical protein IKD57_01785 [Candidatus Saccharibacteria bacterium]|nr:hypothetical protein [Candidatus Saccharibacteria bacterium]
MALLCGVITLVLIIAFGGKETRISTKSEQLSSSLLFCVSSNPVSPFFVSQKVIKPEHELKYFFENDQISKISYKYVGGLNSEKEAEDELSLMNFKYDTYMGLTQIYQEDLTPVFVVLGNDATISFFITRDKFTVETAPLVFLSQENFEKVETASIEEIKSMYEVLGFSCNLEK